MKNIKNFLIGNSINDTTNILNDLKNTPTNNEIWYSTVFGDEINFNGIKPPLRNNKLISNNYDKNKNRGILKFEREIKYVPKSLFFSRFYLRTIQLPKSIKEIKDHAFYYCKQLNTININNIKKIGDDAFSNCYSLDKELIKKIKKINPNAIK